MTKMRYFVIILVFVLITLFMLTNSSKSNVFVNPVPHEKLPITGETVVYVITPTYARPVQKAELTR